MDLIQPVAEVSSGLPEAKDWDEVFVRKMLRCKVIELWAIREVVHGLREQTESVFVAVITQFLSACYEFLEGQLC